ncbi:MAG: hypothetical protein ACI80V_003788, partial [Rhodothermales bacterium]
SVFFALNLGFCTPDSGFATLSEDQYAQIISSQASR